MSSLMSRAPERDRAQPDQHAAGMQRDVGHFGAKLDQRHAELALLGGQAGQSRRHRRGDDRPHAEMRRADHVIEVAQRRRVGGDDVDVDAEALGMEADRLLDALDPVDRVERRMGVEDDPVAAVDRRTAVAQQLVDVRLLDLVAAKLDLDIGDVAGEAAGAEARPDVVDGDPGHALGALDRLAHRDLAGVDVGDIAALDAAALALAGAEHAQPPVLVGRDDQGADLGRADVERGDQGLRSGIGHLLFGTSLRSAASGRIGSPGAARQADDHLAGDAQVDADDAPAQQAGRLVELGEFRERRLRRGRRLRAARPSRRTGN